MMSPECRPVNFSTWDVWRVICGWKEQFRHPINMSDINFIGGKGQEADPSCWGFGDMDGCWHVLDQKEAVWYGPGYGISGAAYRIMSPYGIPGDKLWIRESYALIWPGESAPINPKDNRIEYRADTQAKYPGDWPDDAGKDPACPKWQPSTRMPRWASRFTLTIKDVRVERLQAITEHDATKEGFSPITRDCKIPRFREHWNKTKKVKWEENPWVWVIEFSKD